MPFSMVYISNTHLEAYGDFFVRISNLSKKIAKRGIYRLYTNSQYAGIHPDKQDQSISQYTTSLHT